MRSIVVWTTSVKTSQAAGYCEMFHFCLLCCRSCFHIYTLALPFMFNVYCFSACCICMYHNRVSFHKEGSAHVINALQSTPRLSQDLMQCSLAYIDSYDGHRHKLSGHRCCCCRPHSTNVLPAESSTRIMWQPTVSPPRWQGKAPLCRDSSRGPG